MLLLSIDIGASAITLALQHDNQLKVLQLKNGQNFLSNLLVHDCGETFMGQDAERKVAKHATNSFFAVTHLIDGVLPPNSTLANNVTVKDNKFCFTITSADECKTFSSSHQEMLNLVVSHIKDELIALLQSSTFRIRIVLPKALDQHKKMLETAFSENKLPVECFVPTTLALIHSFMYKSLDSSREETVAIIDVGEAVTNLVVFQHKKGQFKVLVEHEFWFGGRNIDEKIYDYCMGNVPEQMKDQLTEKSKVKLWKACSKVKTLCYLEEIVVDDLIRGYDLDLPFSWENMGNLIKDLLKKFRSELVVVFQSIQTRGICIDKVVPTGRLVHFRAVYDTVKEAAGGLNLSTTLDTSNDVACGGLLFTKGRKVAYSRRSMLLELPNNTEVENHGEISVETNCSSNVTQLSNSPKVESDTDSDIIDVNKKQKNSGNGLHQSATECCLETVDKKQDSTTTKASSNKIGATHTTEKQLYPNQSTQCSPDLLSKPTKTKTNYNCTENRLEVCQTVHIEHCVQELPREKVHLEQKLAAMSTDLSKLLEENTLLTQQLKEKDSFAHNMGLVIECLNEETQALKIHKDKAFIELEKVRQEHRKMKQANERLLQKVLVKDQEISHLKEQNQELKWQLNKQAYSHEIQPRLERKNNKLNDESTTLKHQLVVSAQVDSKPGLATDEQRTLRNQALVHHNEHFTDEHQSSLALKDVKGKGLASDHIKSTLRNHVGILSETCSRAKGHISLHKSGSCCIVDYLEVLSQSVSAIEHCLNGDLNVTSLMKGTQQTSENELSPPMVTKASIERATVPKHNILSEMTVAIRLINTNFDWTLYDFVVSLEGPCVRPFNYKFTFPDQLVHTFDICQVISTELPSNGNLYIGDCFVVLSIKSERSNIVGKIPLQSLWAARIQYFTFTDPSIPKIHVTLSSNCDLKSYFCQIRGECSRRHQSYRRKFV
ncbi:hypothetical protein P9112_003521 [Eukaryota sp. TZLM1-RC]